MEPLGIIVFAVIITTSFSQVLMSSIQRLTNPEKAGEELDLSLGAIILLGINIVVKAILWFWCSKIKGSSSVDALAHDHENDVVFSIASTIFPVVGKMKRTALMAHRNWADRFPLGIYLKMPWLDPLGAIILSIYIIYEWMQILLGKDIVNKESCIEQLMLDYMVGLREHPAFDWTGGQFRGFETTDVYGLPVLNKDYSSGYGACLLQWGSSFG